MATVVPKMRLINDLLEESLDAMNTRFEEKYGDKIKKLEDLKYSSLSECLKDKSKDLSLCYGPVSSKFDIDVGEDEEGEKLQACVAKASKASEDTLQGLINGCVTTFQQSMWKSTERELTRIQESLHVLL